jgi:signal transduction histidine kinase
VSLGRRAGRLLPRSLRTRVTAVAALAVLAVLTVAGVGLVTAQRSALLEALEETLDQQADSLAARIRSGAAVSADDMPDEDVLAEVVAPDGRVLAASPGLEGPLPAIDPPVTGSRVTTVELPTSGESVRLLVREVDGVTLRLAGDLDDVGDSVGALGAGLLVAVPLSTAVLALVVWWAVGRALRPVDDIRRRVEEISGARLDQRVPEPGTGDEIARLARTMNAMLARLEESARRQRRFVSDAAHELRSPLARMRAELEVDQAHPATADPTGTADSVLAETVGLQHLVDDLLLLARGDEGVDGPPDAGPVDLDALVARAARRARPGEIRIDRSGVEPVQLHGSPAQLERVLTNLLDNAVRHAKQQVTVTVRAAPDGAAEVVVADDGPGIPDDQRERVFERFTRLDEARTAGEGGAGLGLAIAREIAERHGGSLALAPRGPGARFVLRLPAAGRVPRARVAAEFRGRSHPRE